MGWICFPITVSGFCADLVSFLARCKPSRFHSAADSFIFPSAHKQQKLKIFLVKLVGGVIRFRGRYDFGICRFKCLGDYTLIYGISSGKTFDFHYDYAVIFVFGNIRKELLHLRTGSDIFTADYFLVDVGNVQFPTAGELRELGVMPCKGFPFSLCFGFDVGTGFSEIDCV